MLLTIPKKGLEDKGPGSTKSSIKQHTEPDTALLVSQPDGGPFLRRPPRRRPSALGSHSKRTDEITDTMKTTRQGLTIAREWARKRRRDGWVRSTRHPGDGLRAHGGTNKGVRNRRGWELLFIKREAHKCLGGSVSPCLRPFHFLWPP